MRSPLLPGCIALSILGYSASTPAQSLTERIASTDNGAVSFHFAPRPGICGDGEQFVRIGRSFHGSFRTSQKHEPCVVGPVQVRLTMRDGHVARVESWVGRLRPRDARDLGGVSAPEGARFLMSIAQRGASGASAKAMFPAMLADSATVWPALLAIAKDSASRSSTTRKDAMLWLSRFASAALAGHANDLFAEEESKSDGLKEHAVFVLSQLPRSEGVPALLDVARTNSDQRVRSSALFWLGQSGDRRAVALFEEVLSNR